ncbi:OLC1v1033168C4 [Oldenlandia corymbosa var. corymbosa]|uniref:OLC1v1033168C4 n=1 Tax=Oldenlandia corymbosa var. corymbosa TaxID=529605 RepID=A0AAV1CP74_OLDCO|nr:OLC1v1033168C4 [Oldenlandia corymbosa var. corymbosa]
MASMDIKIQDHGTVVDGKKQRIMCNHCEKVVSGYSRLKCHLGGIRGDVVPCIKVPADVKEAFGKEVRAKKKGNLTRDVGKLSPPNLPTRRTWSCVSSSTELSVPESFEPSEDENEKRARTGASSRNGGRSFPLNPCTPSVTTKQYSLSTDAQKAIGKFFYETGLDFTASSVRSFHRMMNASTENLHTIDGIPSSEDLKGWILQEVYKEVHADVQSIRESWASTGCSILLDGWQDSRGRNLLHILAACPRGTVYIQSVDITGFDRNISFMLLLLDGVIDDVGVENVLQIVTYTTSPWMAETGKRFMEQHGTVFWTVSDSLCIKLMLERIGRREDVHDTLVKAKTITSFVHSDFFVLKLMRDLTSVHDLVFPSKFNFLIPFLTLENLFVERKNIQKLFCSTFWETSKLASTLEGRKVAKLVADDSFWEGANQVLHATMPLVRGLELLSKNDVPKIAYIYETMDQVKEKIEKNFEGKESCYQPVWDDIDYIWNNYLHSPLHAAGYLLNPYFRYADGFSDDSEVRSGIDACFARLSGNYDRVCSQLLHYEMGDGAFHQGISCALKKSPGSNMYCLHYYGSPLTTKLNMML